MLFEEDKDYSLKITMMQGIGCLSRSKWWGIFPRSLKQHKPLPLALVAYCNYLRLCCWGHHTLWLQDIEDSISNHSEVIFPAAESAVQASGGFFGLEICFREGNFIPGTTIVLVKCPWMVRSCTARENLLLFLTKWPHCQVVFQILVFILRPGLISALVRVNNSQCWDT